MRNINIDDAEKMAKLADEINEKCEELWSIGMKNLLINSREYKAICALGKKSNKSHRLIFSKLESVMPSDRVEKIMPMHSKAILFN